MSAKPECPYALCLDAVGELLAKAVEEVSYEPVAELAAKLPGHPANPYGAVLITFCRSCDCTHASYFSPDGETRANPRAVNALRVAITQLESEIANGKKPSCEETTH